MYANLTKQGKSLHPNKGKNILQSKFQSISIHLQNVCFHMNEIWVLMAERLQVLARGYVPYG